jgi:hypothetical protein
VRDYLYLWHDPQTKRLVVSGIEFRDFVSELQVTGGIILLRHQFGEALYDRASHFDFVPADGLTRLAADDIYAYGDFCWADFDRSTSMAKLSDAAIAELAFFAQMVRPLAGTEIPGLGNHFLCWAHDDGWFARIFYSRWNAVGLILRQLLPAILGQTRAMKTLDLVRRGKEAVWCHKGTVTQCEPTEDIDALQQKHMAPRRLGRKRH